MNFRNGDILEAKHRGPKKGIHYIVFYEGANNDDFIGGMITHSKSNKNERMEKFHFETHSEKGDKFKVTYDNSFLVKGKFIKPNDWGPYEKVGQLTPRGIFFFNRIIEECHTELFSTYYRRTNRPLRAN